MQRRDFIKLALSGAGALTAGGGLRNLARAGHPKAPTRPGAGPYGPLGAPDVNGVQLPPGFTSRVLARTGEVVPGTGYTWHQWPDGGATFATVDEGWIYVSNSEIYLEGGASALRFDAGGSVTGAYRILAGTNNNCAGGPTPWGTWLSCEETPIGQVWECDPTGATAAVVRPALGMFSHEAVTVDPVRERLYLTEDATLGRLRRFTPVSYPDLSAGTLEVALADADGKVTWLPGDTPPGVATTFDGGEGVWYDAGYVYFATKGDDRLWVLDPATDMLSVLYDPGDLQAGEEPYLLGVDNVVVSRSGDLYVVEDGGNMEMVLVTADTRELVPFLRVIGQDASELTGPAFDPSGTRLYFSSQRGTVDAGITYEVSGPFRTDEHRGGANGSRPPTLVELINDRVLGQS